MARIKGGLYSAPRPASTATTPTATTIMVIATGISVHIADRRDRLDRRLAHWRREHELTNGLE